MVERSSSSFSLTKACDAAEDMLSSLLKKKVDAFMTLIKNVKWMINEPPQNENEYVNKVIIFLETLLSTAQQILSGQVAPLLISANETLLLIAVDDPKVKDETVKLKLKMIDIEVSTKKESMEHVEEVKDVEPVNQEELTPNDENNETGVSQKDDKYVVVELEVDEKDDMEAEEEPVEDNKVDMEKEEVDEKENKATIDEKKVETKADVDKVELKNEPLDMEKPHNEELKAEDGRQKRLCFSDEEKDKDIDEDELTDEKREEHEGHDARRRVVAREYKYFSLSEYARVGGALALYDVEEKNAAIAKMKYISISFKGEP
nr:exocyst complex component SEC15B [Tanacetum cinerariifolium]